MASSGPKRIAKFAMKRKKTKTTWDEERRLLRCAPSPLEDSGPVVPSHEPPRNQPDDRDDARTRQVPSFIQKRQNQTRRRAIDVLLAEARAVVPEQARRRDQTPEHEVRDAPEDDHVPIVAASDWSVVQPLYCLNQT